MANLSCLDKNSKGLLTGPPSSHMLTCQRWSAHARRCWRNKTHAQRLRAWADTLVRWRSTWRADGVTAADVFYSRWQTAGQVVKVRGRQSPKSDWLITWSCKQRVSPGQSDLHRLVLNAWPLYFFVVLITFLCGQFNAVLVWNVDDPLIRKHWEETKTFWTIWK